MKIRCGSISKTSPPTNDWKAIKNKQMNEKHSILVVYVQILCHLKLAMERLGVTACEVDITASMRT